MKTFSSKSRGFTLLELLVVIAIIGILTGIVVTSANPARQRARDAKRIADLGTIQSAVTLYYDRCKQFPSAISGDLTQIKAGCPTTPTQISLASFISVIPTQPNGGAVYGYTTFGSPPNDYVLSVSLESYNEVLKDDIDAATFGVTCTDNVYCLSSK